MSCSHTEPSDPRVRRTRKLLQEAMRGLLHEKTFADISVQDIAERATVNRATFYAHYADKDDLATSILRADLQSAIFQRFTERPAVTRESLTAFAVIIFTYIGNLYDACPKAAIGLQNTQGATLQEVLYEHIVHWISASGDDCRRLFPGASLETVATVFTWSVYGEARRWSVSPNRDPAARICREIISILLPGDK